VAGQEKQETKNKAYAQKPVPAH